MLPAETDDIVMVRLKPRLFGHPERNPRYDIGVPSTWWYDEEKAKRIHFAGR